MQIILVHGMGRSPLSMAWLGLRLRWAGHRTHAFGYSAAREGFSSCSARLAGYMQTHIGNQRYAVIGHSLGTVLLRQALTQMPRQPAATFLLAPPSRACVAARFFSAHKIYRLLTGDMGQRLAQSDFMQSLPLPPRNSLVIAGTAGWRCNGEASDGVLSVSETLLPGTPHLLVHAWHTFIMNHRTVFLRINQTLETLT